MKKETALRITLFSIALSTAALQAAEPEVLGYGKDTFTIGEELYSTDFSDKDNWVIQVSTDNTDYQERIKIEDGILDLYMPKRGCTAWLNKKFSGPITITYQVRCPSETTMGDAIMVTDVNNFWHCTDPRQADAIFKTTDTHYHGGFLGYHELHGYYASTGGGRNSTTRMRRYPRWVDGKDVPHIALNSNDKKPEFLIVPDQWHTIQLVVFNGMVQYIKDGQVVYEIKEGDSITVESRDAKNKRQKHEETYTLDKYPAYNEGYFGFRMVSTHHQYKNLTINRLEPTKSKK